MAQSNGGEQKAQSNGGEQKAQSWLQQRSSCAELTSPWAAGLTIQTPLSHPDRRQWASETGAGGVSAAPPLKRKAWHTVKICKATTKTHNHPTRHFALCPPLLPSSFDRHHHHYDLPHIHFHVYLPPTSQSCLRELTRVRSVSILVCLQPFRTTPQRTPAVSLRQNQRVEYFLTCPRYHLLLRRCLRGQRC